LIIKGTKPAFITACKIKYNNKKKIILFWQAMHIALKMGEGMQQLKLNM